MRDPGEPCNVSVFVPTVREFIHIIAAQAKSALVGIGKPGFLQISRLHPSSDSESPVPSRYMLDDVEYMINACIGDSEAGHNVYVEGRTVREDLGGRERGKLQDTRAVFALVVDSDADKDRGWTPPPTMRVSMTVETSPGNFQYWLFLRKAISAQVAQKLGVRLRAAINSDDDTGNPTQPYRVAGTINYPNPKKVERGRVTVPTKIVEFDPEALWSLRDLARAFPRPPRQGNGAGSTAGATSTADETDIPVDTMEAIRNGGRMGDDRSHVFWNVTVVLKRLGWQVDGIIHLFEKYPDGIAKKYRGRLRQEVERVYSKLYQNTAQKKFAEESATNNADDVPLHWHGDIDAKVARPCLVEGLLPQTGTGLLSGQWGVYKTFCSLDLSAAVMAGATFIEFPVARRGGVLFIAPEGASEIAVRLQAVLDAKYPELHKAPFAWTDVCPRLLDDNAVDTLSALARCAADRMHKEFGLPLSLIVIDTVVAAAGFATKGEENDAATSQIVMNRMAALSRNTGAITIGVDHFGKNSNTGTRGSSAKEGAADVVLALLGDKSVEGTVSNTRLAVRKNRSGPSGQEFAFAPRVVDMGVDDKGRQITSLVLDWAPTQAQAAGKDKVGAARWSKSLKLLQRALMAVLVDQGQEVTPFIDGPTVRAANIEYVREEFYRSYPADGDQAKKQATRQKAFRRAVSDASDRNLIGVREVETITFVWFAQIVDEAP